MKAIISTMAFIEAMVLLCQCEKDEPIPIVNILDNNFLNALIEQYITTENSASEYVKTNTMACFVGSVSLIKKKENQTENTSK